MHLPGWHPQSPQLKPLPFLNSYLKFPQAAPSSYSNSHQTVNAAEVPAGLVIRQRAPACLHVMHSAYLLNSNMFVPGQWVQGCRGQSPYRSSAWCAHPLGVTLPSVIGQMAWQAPAGGSLSSAEVAGQVPCWAGGRCVGHVLSFSVVISD